MTEGILTGDLLAAASAHLLSVSSHQLKRLRREGLLQRPNQRHRVGHAGSVAEYSADAVEQLLGVLRLKAAGYETYKELRVAAWLGGLFVEFAQLRSDVVDLLREEIAGQQGLHRGREDDQLDRRLARVPTSQAPMALRFEKSIGKLPLRDVLLTVLQLAVDTRGAVTASETLDTVFAFTDPGQPAISDLYFEWELPGTPKWPRIISRSSARWFPVGLEWLRFVSGFLALPELLDDLAPSPAVAVGLRHWRAQFSSSEPNSLQLRNLVACQGIVLGKQRPNELIEMFVPET